VPDGENCFISILSRRRQQIADSAETTKCVAKYAIFPGERYAAPGA